MKNYNQELSDALRTAANILWNDYPKLGASFIHRTILEAADRMNELDSDYRHELDEVALKQACINGQIAEINNLKAKIEELEYNLSVFKPSIAHLE